MNALTDDGRVISAPLLSRTSLEHVEGAGAVSIAGIGTALPRHRVEGGELLAALGDLWPRVRRRLGQFHPEVEGGTRYLVRPVREFAQPLSLGEQRMRYLEEATRLAHDAAAAALAASGEPADRVGLLIVASCTGFILPGVDVRLVQRLGLSENVRRLPLAHFGCAGGAAGMALAADWVQRDESRRALVVAVEVPSITFRPADTSSDNLLSALVFGDGAAAAVLSAEVRDSGALQLRRARSALVAGSRDALGFEVVDDGYRVVVSRRLPELVEAQLPRLVQEFLDTPAAQLDAVAIHPGGRAIVDAVARCLALDDAQVTATRRVLERTGNTSSAALLFVLTELAADLPSASGRGLAMAFGPGLSIELLDIAWGC